MDKQKKYPWDDNEPFNSVREMLKDRANQCGERAAIVFEENKKTVTVTYNELYKQTLYLGTALTKRGYIKKRVSCIGQNRYKWIEVYLTALSSTNVFVPIDKDLPEKDIINVINHSEADIVFCDEKYLPLLQSGATEKEIEIVSLDSNEKEPEQTLEKLIAEGKKLYDEGDRSFTDTAPNDVKELKMILYTSGTTGKSKGVMLSEKNITSDVYAGLSASRIYTVGLSVLPYHHAYESVCGILGTLYYKSTMCINGKLKNVLKNFKKYKPDFIFVVPAFAEMFHSRIMKNIKASGKEKGFKALVKLSNILRKFGIDKRKKFFREIHDVFGGNMIKILCGGAPLRGELVEFFDDIGIALVSGYGITECSPLVTANRDFYNFPGTTGLPLPGLEVEISEPDADGIGEIKVKGPTVMMGYYKDPKQTAEVLRDGWFYTGDYGKFDSCGRLIITGRKKNMIVLTNGKNVFPEEIEEYIAAIDEVKEVIVYSQKTESGEEKDLTAQIYVDPDTPISETDLRKKINEVLAPLPQYKQIMHLILRDTEFEKTTSNKIKRQLYI